MHQRQDELDAAADAAMRRLADFQSRHWAYLSMRDRPHPITGKVAPRNPLIDRECAQLVNAARAANQEAERNELWWVQQAQQEGPDPLNKQFGDLLFLLHDAWPLIHGHGSQMLKQQWAALMRSYGDFAQAPATPSLEGNRQLYAALVEGGALVCHVTSRETLREQYRRVMALHAALGVPALLDVAHPAESSQTGADASMRPRARP